MKFLDLLLIPGVSETFINGLHYVLEELQKLLKYQYIKVLARSRQYTSYFLQCLLINVN